MSDNGKGDDIRPMDITQEEWDRNHELAFGKKKPWWEIRNEKLRQEEAIKKLQEEAEAAKKGTP